ncbi:MAG: tRNA(Glu)-specific nuclease WapA precursor, partial [Acidobacteriota bacterium]
MSEKVESLVDSVRHRGSGFRRKWLPTVLAIVVVSVSLGLMIWGLSLVEGSGTTGAARITSAAYDSKSAPLAPESLATAYREGVDGPRLAVETAESSSRVLPTELGGTTVRVRGQAAGLLYVSPDQVNFQIPSGLESGVASVIITAGDGAVSRGVINIAPVSPALFAADGTGHNAPVGIAQSYRRNDLVIRNLFEDEPGDDRSNPARLEPGDEGTDTTLVLYGTGMRGYGDLSRVKAIIGGLEVPVDYVGPDPDSPGIDQVQVRMPDSLVGSGRIGLTIHIEGMGLSNSLVINASSGRGQTPPRIDSFFDTVVRVSEPLAINGSGFDLQAAGNVVRIGGLNAQVDKATESQLLVRVPFGVGGGDISVKTSRGEAVIRPKRPNTVRIRTSLSGLVEDTQGRPVRGLRVELEDTTISPAVTNDKGVFIFSDIPKGGYVIRYNSVASLLPYPNVRTIKNNVFEGKDTYYGKVNLQQIDGQSYQFSSPTTPTQVRDTESEPVIKLEEQGLIFEFQQNTVATFPGGATSGRLTLSRVKNSLTPTILPPGQFSRVVAQLTLTGTILNPGGKLTFPNEDGYTSGSNVDLYRLDQTPGSPTIGTFIRDGIAVVSADGQRIETGPNSIREASIYFVSNLRPVTTVVGRVVRAGDNLPVQGAQVQAVGQQTLTDATGAFILRDVRAEAGVTFSVESVFVRPDGLVARGRQVDLRAVVGGITTLPVPIVLETEGGNRPPVISIVETRIKVNAGETREFNFISYDPDGPSPRVTLAPQRDWTRIIDRGEGRWAISVAPPLAEQGGTRFLRLTAIDIQSEQVELDLEVKVNAKPVAGRLSSDLSTEQNTPLSFTLSGTDADNDSLTYLVATSPANGTLNGNGPTLTYRPRRGWSGTDRFTFKVNDGMIDSDAVTVTIVTLANKPPVLTVPAVRLQADPAQLIKFGVTATDSAGGQMLTLGVKNVLPSGAVFNSSTGEFTWTPLATQTGVHPIVFVVTDDGTPALSDEKTVEITVTNSAPTLTVPGEQVVNAGELLRFNLAASDPDSGQTLALTASNLPTGATLSQPSGTGNGQFTWTPAGTQTGIYTLSFRVTDNGSPALSDTRTVKITVVNRAPALTVPGAQSVTAGQALSFAVTATDPDSGQALTLTASSLPTGAAFNQPSGSGSGQFTWTPAGTQTGSYIVNFTVTDNGAPALSETRTVTITVLNRAPALIVPGPQTTRV